MPAEPRGLFVLWPFRIGQLSGIVVSLITSEAGYRYVGGYVVQMVLFRWAQLNPEGGEVRIWHSIREGSEGV